MKLQRQMGWNAFRILWAGQAISLLGTGMTRFAVMIWAYEREGTATALALLGFWSCITYILVSPFAGVLVDRWDRRRVMFFADLGAGLMTTFMLVMYQQGQLALWHLYLAQGITGALEAFQDPAFSASVSLMLPKEQYTRANGMLGLGKSAARMFAPILAPLVQTVSGLQTVMAIDLATMGLAMAGLVVVKIPRPPQVFQIGGARTFRQELFFGLDYILHRPGLRGLTLTFFLVNLFGTLTYFAVLSPMILTRTGGDQIALGWVRTVMGAGGILGGVLISLWGGTRRKAFTYLVSTGLSFLVCDFLTATSKSVVGWSVAGFLSELTIPFIVSPYFALWQEKVPVGIQGRVFSSRDMIQVFSQPVGYLAGGLLADQLFEPAFMPGGLLANSLGWLVGTGPGAGMSAMFLATSLLGGFTGLMGLLSPAIRAMDDQRVNPGLESPVKG